MYLVRTTHIHGFCGFCSRTSADCFFSIASPHEASAGNCQHTFLLPMEQLQLYVLDGALQPTRDASKAAKQLSSFMMTVACTRAGDVHELTRANNKYILLHTRSYHLYTDICIWIDRWIFRKLRLSRPSSCKNACTKPILGLVCGGLGVFWNRAMCTIRWKEDWDDHVLDFEQPGRRCLLCAGDSTCGGMALRAAFQAVLSVTMSTRKFSFQARLQ